MSLKSIVYWALIACITIAVLCAIITLSGVVRLWFFVPQADQKDGLPYLGWLLSTFVGSVLAILFSASRRALRDLPDRVVHKTRKETTDYLLKFIAEGSSAIIYTNKGGWLYEDGSKEAIDKLLLDGVSVTVIATPLHAERLKAKYAGTSLVVVERKETNEPKVRFTLLNSNRIGGERLAIADGCHPEHGITVYSSSNGINVITMAKELIAEELC